MNTTQLKIRLDSLVLFRPLLKDEVVKRLYCFLDNQTAESYSSFVSALYEANGGDLTNHIRTICYNCENVYVKMLGKGETPKSHITDCLNNELKLLSEIAGLSCSALAEMVDEGGCLARFESESINLASLYKKRAQSISQYGYGKFSQNPMFTISSVGEIIAVKNPDSISLENLVDYEIQREAVINNTVALLKGKPAANILLTGDAGTGKSSTVKAVCNRFYNDGLRLIELRKDQLSLIPEILDQLADNPLKFILFIDDLSFLADDDNYNALKAVLEGSVSARSQNTVIYATSNRRHIVRETFSDRQGDEVHRNDAMQEMISLADRFGMHLSFHKPDKKTYLHIVRRLAKDNKITLDEELLEMEAERFALERGGRSARLAKQYIDSILSK